MKKKMIFKLNKSFQKSSKSYYNLLTILKTLNKFGSMYPLKFIHNKNNLWN